MLYKVQDLGLPDRWNNFTVFSSEVSRLVLLSERGRTHGSIWGVPPFLEGILRATVATTMTTSYFYSYIETTSYQTTYTITLKARQSAYSVMGEVWVSDDGKNWYRVGKGWDLYSGPITACGTDTFCDSFGYDDRCGTYVYSRRWLNNKCYGGNCLTQAGPPKIGGSSIFMSEGGSQIIYQIFYVKAGESVTAQAGNSFWQYGNSQYCDCYWVVRVTEWGKRYVPQAIELVDWDTGEVYGSTNSTSFTFQIYRNTIVRFKYVRAESWSNSWTVIPPPPPTTPDQCQQILNDPSKVGSPEWCACAAIYDPEQYKKKCIPDQSCLTVSVVPCCSGDTSTGCLDSWSVNLDGWSSSSLQSCVKVPQGTTQKISISWSASWSLKSGWSLADVGKRGDANCDLGSKTGNSASGTCWVDAQPNRDYSATVVIIFKKTQ